VDINAVGAMDVSWSEAQRSFGANVIARSDDRATSEDVGINAVGAMDVSVKTERSGVLART
jgi:hypothetical protein